MLLLFVLMRPRPRRSTLFPYTTLFRSMGELPLEPFPLFSARPERRVRIQNQREERGAEAHRVPPVRPQGQSAERFPPVLEARGRLAAGASRELVIAERGKHRDLLLRPLEGLALVGRV